jgi:hypothetical protein
MHSILAVNRCAGVVPMAVVVIFAQPAFKLLVQIVQTHRRCNAGQKLLANSAEKSFDFSLSLGQIRPCVHQGDAQRGRGMLKVLGAKGAAVVGVQLSGKSSSEQCFFKGIQKGGKVLGQLKLRIGHQAAVIVDKGDQIGFFLTRGAGRKRAVHHIALPQIVGQLGFKFAPITAAGGRVHQLVVV